VRKPPVAVALKVFSVGNNVGCAEVTPAITIPIKTCDGRNERCIVNCHFDLAT